MTCPAPSRSDKRYVEPDTLIPSTPWRRVSWTEAKERYPDLSPGDGMEQIMVERLNGTWRTWMRGELPSFTFQTQEKSKDWTPNYWKLMAGGQGRSYPEIRNGMAQESVEAVRKRRRNGPSHYVQRQKI